MPFDSILGQSSAVETLEHMLRSGRVHHAMRFEGPRGVGKELTAMAFAQALVCTSGDPVGCGTCSACRRVVTTGSGVPEVPSHPDVIILERGLYPHEAIGRSRAEAQELSIDQVRTLVIARASFPPHEGRARVYIVRRAEEPSLSASNALLKNLEEPGNNTFFILLVSRPGKMLSTIRSRTMRVRFAPLSDSALGHILLRSGLSAQQAERVIPMSGGSAGMALVLASEEGVQQRDAFVKHAIEALAAKDSTASLDLAEADGRDRQAIRSCLEALAVYFAQQACEAVSRSDPAARYFALRHEIVLDALSGLERNAAAALLIENMMLRIRAETR